MSATNLDGGARVSVPAVDLVGQLANALRERVESQRRAEAALAAFAFTETPRETDAGTMQVDWRYHATRALRAIADPAMLPLVAALADADQTLDELSNRVGGPGSHFDADRLAIVDAVSGLATAGLVVRQLETDRVHLTPLGAALLALVDEVGRRAAEAAP